MLVVSPSIVDKIYSIKQIVTEPLLQNLLFNKHRAAYWTVHHNL